MNIWCIKFDRMCIFILGYVYVYVYVHVYVCLYVYVYVNMYEYVHVYEYVHMYEYEFVSLDIRIMDMSSPLSRPEEQVTHALPYRESDSKRMLA